MAWQNIYDLAEWSLYLQFNSAASATPDSATYLVPIAELDAVAGSVSVVDGVIVCNMNGLSGGGGTEVTVVAMPNGTPPVSAPFRVTAIVDESPITIGEDGGALQTIASVAIAGGANEYARTGGAVNDSLSESTVVTHLQGSGNCPSGQGLALQINYGGF